MKMQKLELNEWDKEKVQKEADKEMMKLHGMYLGFIEEKLGEDAVIECISIMAKQEADAIQNIPAKEKGALKLVVNQGITQKNIHGSKDVEVEGNEDQATVTIGKCMALENTREFIKMGAPMTSNSRSLILFSSKLSRIIQPVVVDFPFDMARRSTQYHKMFANK